MAKALEREGTFRVRPMECGLRDYPSGAIAVSIRFAILAQQIEDGWLSWEQSDLHEQYGNFNIVKIDGQLNEPTVRHLIEALGWSGDLNAFANPGTQYTDCQIVVQEETYDGKTMLKVLWINTFDYEGGMNCMESAAVKQLQATHGSALRAIAGNVKRNGTPPKPQVAPEPVEAADGAPPPTDADIPY